MDYQTTIKDIEGLDIFVKGHKTYITKKTLSLDDHINDLGQFMRERAGYDISALELQINDFLGKIIAKAHIQTLEIFAPHSVSIGAILAAIWTAINAIVDVIKAIVAFLDMIHIKEIHDILYALWPEYKKTIDKIYGRIAELGKAIGWGADGVGHVLMAIQGMRNVAGSLMGKDEMWLQNAWAEKAIDISKDIAYNTSWAQNDAGDFLNWVFYQENIKSNAEMSGWAGKTLGFISEAADRGEEALKAASGVFNDLSAIQNNMPALIAKHIPTKIWTALADYEAKINDNILPALAKLERFTDRVEDMLGIYSDKFSELSKNLSNPGDLLLRIDALDNYAKSIQEQRIDDAASRSFGQAAAKERILLKEELDDFDLIQAAINTTRPELSFMNLDDPSRAAVTGIIAEPLETWFVNGYNDQL